MASLLSIVVLLAVAYSGFCEEKVFLQRAGKEFNSRQYRSVLTVNNGEKFGDWTWPEICPDNFFAVGFSVRVESKQHGGDDTTLNGIRLICFQDESRSLSGFFLSNFLSSFGDWSHPQYCPSGVLTSFQIRVEPHRGMLGDDTAVNNIKFRCSSNPMLEAAGIDWVEYGFWSENCTNGGIETKMEDYQWGLDDSTLNDVRLFCCDKHQ